MAAWTLKYKECRIRKQPGKWKAGQEGAVGSSFADFVCDTCTSTSLTVGCRMPVIRVLVLDSYIPTLHICNQQVARQKSNLLSLSHITEAQSVLRR